MRTAVLIHRLVLAVFALAILGCGIGVLNAAKNDPAAMHDHRSLPRATIKLDPTAARSKAFFGIAMSGGGSRAANFSAAILTQLQARDLLKHVSAISSVSGSSLTAALYGVHGDQFWTEATEMRRHLRTNFELLWAWRLWLPQNFIRGVLTAYDRSDVMASVFDSKLFKGATFRQLKADGPAILINASSFTTGRRFVFTDETFAALNSRLDTYPIAYAVMASAAFPGVFPNVTLHDYSIAKDQHYEHLFDGGPTDNLGTTTLISVIEHLEQERTQIDKENGRTYTPLPCLLLVVDAYPFAELPSNTLRADTRGTRGPIGHLIDPNALAASDVLLTVGRRRLLAELGIDVDRVDLRPWVKIAHVSKRFPEISCYVWHLSFQRLLATSFPSHGQPSIYSHSRQVGLVVNSIPTRFQLTGVTPFTSMTLQDYIFEAARLLIHNDGEARTDKNGAEIFVPYIRLMCEGFFERSDENCISGTAMPAVKENGVRRANAA